MTSDSSTETIRWTPFGSCNKQDFTTGSCHLYETKDKDGATQRVLIDLGLYTSWNWKSPDTSKRDVMPDIRPYLKKKGEKKEPKKGGLDALFLTHGHEDHIFGISSYLRLGYELPQIHGTPFTLAILRRRLATDQVPLKDWPEMAPIFPGYTKSIGGLSVEAVSVSHTVPDSLGYYLKTKDVSVFHTGDFKMDDTLPVGHVIDRKRLKEIGDEGLDALMLDATTTGREGRAAKERDIRKAYDDLFTRYPDKRKIVAVAPNHIMRQLTILNAAARADLSVVMHGTERQKLLFLSLQESGYDTMKTLGGHVSILEPDSSEAQNLPPEKTLILTNGNYAEGDGPLNKMSHDWYKGVKINAGDVVISESSGEPREEKYILEMLARLKALGATVHTGMDEPGIYGSGHAYKEDFLEIADLMKPGVSCPMHGSQALMGRFRSVAHEVGVATTDKQILNGMSVEITPDGPKADYRHDLNWLGVSQTSGGRMLEVSLPQAMHKTNKEKQWREARKAEARRKLKAHKRGKKNLMRQTWPSSAPLTNIQKMKKRGRRH